MSDEDRGGPPVSGDEAIRLLFEGYSSDFIGIWMMENEYWPERKPSTAGARVRANNNTDKDQYWHFCELTGFSAYTGRRVLADHVCDCVPGLGRPTWDNAPRSPLQEDLERLYALDREREQVMRRIETQHRIEHAASAAPEPDGEGLGAPDSVRRVRFSRG